MAKAEKSARMRAKEFAEDIKKSNDKTLAKTAAVRIMKKQEERDRSHNIKELIESDKKERDKVHELRKKQQSDLIALKAPERERREKARSYVASEDQSRQLSLASRLAEIEEKIMTHEARRFNERNKIAFDAHARNTIKDVKFSEIAQRKVVMEETLFRDFETAENAKHKKLRNVYKEMHFLWTDYKEKKNAKSDLMRTK